MDIDVDRMLAGRVQYIARAAPADSVDELWAQLLQIGKPEIAPPLNESRGACCATLFVRDEAGGITMLTSAPSKTIHEALLDLRRRALAGGWGQ